MFSVRLDGDTRRMMRQLSRFAYLDKKAVNASMGEAVRESTVERFKLQKSPDDKKWTPSQRALETGGVTLTRKARLRNSIKSAASAEGFAVGTNTIYARTHQLGAKNRIIKAKKAKYLRFMVSGRWVRAKEVRVSIPARPFLGLSGGDMRELKKTLEDNLKEE